MKVKLYEPFMKWYRGGKIYLCSDPHFQKDTEMEQYFHWPTAEERLRRINNVVTKNDTFVCLGDVGDRLELVSKIKCDYKVLITGNHDAGVQTYKRVKDFHITYALTKEEAKEIITNLTYYAGGIIEHKIEDKWVDLRIRQDGDRWEIYSDNHLFDEVYDGPLFIRDKLVLSHERVELPFALNIHGHEHMGVYATQKVLYSYGEPYNTYLINIASDVVDFKPIALDDILKDYPLKLITDIHRITIDYATKEITE